MSESAAVIPKFSFAPTTGFELPELQLIYDTAPVGLAFLTPECRYVQINQRLTEICGMSVADHIGRTVRETVPAVADQVELVVRTVVSTGEPLTGIEVNGQRPDGSNAGRVWLTSWHPVRSDDNKITGISVVAEEITDRKRAESELAASATALRESEARFRELADCMSQFAWTATPTGERYWFNKRWHDYTGTTLDEVKGFGWRKVHHPDHIDRVMQFQRECFANGTPWEDTFPLRGRDGTYRWFLSRALPIRSGSGEVLRWFGTNTDVTEKIVAEQALRELNATLEHRVEAETQERLRIWNVSDDLLLVADRDGTYLRVNPAWTATLGWEAADIVGRNWQWNLHPDDYERSRLEVKYLVSTGRTQRFENRYRHTDGSYRWLSWSAATDQERVYAVARDITELKNAEQQLRESRRELARVTRQTTLAAMTASIAHEINQPLSAIVASGNAGLRWLAREEPDIGEAQEVLKRIVKDGHRAADIISSIRAMFRKDAHAREQTDINELVREVLALAHGEIEGQRAFLRTDLSGLVPVIAVEKVPLQQVILNLVMNALEAMSLVIDRDRILSVKTEPQGAHGVLITVADTGPGIHASNIERIFQPFFSTKKQGMGMGLAICRSIVEAHGGKLWATSDEAPGCVFHIDLPGDRGADPRALHPV